jgi:hypothetical protein
MEISHVKHRLASIESHIQQCEYAMKCNWLQGLGKNHSNRALTVRLDRCMKDSIAGRQAGDRKCQALLERCIDCKGRLYDVQNRIRHLQSLSQNLESDSGSSSSSTIGPISHLLHQYSVDYFTLSDEDIKIIGKTLWQNRTLFSYKTSKSMTFRELNELKKLKRLCHHVLRNKVVLANSGKRDFVIKLIDRLVAPSYPIEMTEHLTKHYLNPKDARNLISAVATIEPQFAGALEAGFLVDQINANEIPFGVIFDRPELQDYILPYVKNLNFQICKPIDQQEAEYLLTVLTDSCPLVEELHLPHNYKGPIPTALLSRLKTLVMGFYYNYPFPAGVDLSNLVRLKLGYSYNQELPVSLENLREFEMGSCYTHSIVGLDLRQLQILKIGCGYTHRLTKDLNLENLVDVQFKPGCTAKLSRYLKLPKLENLDFPNEYEFSWIPQKFVDFIYDIDAAG